MDFSCLLESQLCPPYLATDSLGQAGHKLNLSRVLVWRCCCFHMLLQSRFVHQCDKYDQHLQFLDEIFLFGWITTHL